MNAQNKKFLKDTFNIDVDKYSKEKLDEILRVINKKILTSTKETLIYNKELVDAINYYKLYFKDKN